jgi:hypothetical protein
MGRRRPAQRDAAALNALLDAGADIEAPGSVLGGPPLADATGFAQWHAAHRLVERGAKTTLSDAATLGLIDRLESYFAGDAAPSPAEITRAFWAPATAANRARRSISSPEVPS